MQRRGEIPSCIRQGSGPISRLVLTPCSSLVQFLGIFVWVCGQLQVNPNGSEGVGSTSFGLNPESTFPRYVPAQLVGCCCSSRLYRARWWPGVNGYPVPWVVVGARHCKCCV